MDTIELKPAVFSILIGINNQRHGVPLEQFEPVYDALRTEAKTANPKLRVVLCEPFTLPVGKRKENCETWRAGVQAIQDAVAQLATSHGAALVRFRPSCVAKLKKPTGSGGATIFNLHDGGMPSPSAF